MNDSGANSAVYGISLQSNGKIIVLAISQDSMASLKKSHNKLNSDGKTDPTINYGTGADY
jgi:hypothetical protein